MKKTLLTIGAATSVFAPIAAVVSCSWGYEGRYDADDDGKLKLMVAFRESSSQYKAVEKIVEIWNKGPNKKLELIHSKEKIGSKLAQMFEAGDKKKVPNMIIDYPDTLGTLVKYDMEIQVATPGVKALFDPKFMEMNDGIGGIKKGSGTFAIPIAKSIDIATYNTPVFKHIWNRAVDLGIAEDDLPKSNHWASAASGNENETAINAIWKPTAVTKANYTPPTKKFKFAEVRDNGEKMLDFITIMRPLFVKNKEAYILGIDSAVNFIYQSVYQAAKANIDDFIFSKGNDGYMDYKWGGKNNSAAIFKRVYNKFRLAIESKALFLKDGISYSSSLETHHKIAVAYGSSAGYSHNFIPISKVGKYIASDHKETLFKGTADILDKKTTVNKGVVATFGKYHTKIILSDKSYTKGSYDVKLADTVMEGKYNIFVADKTNVFVTSKKHAEGIDAADKLELTGGKFLVSMTSVQNSDTINTLQENEVEIWNTPATFGVGSAKAELVQGPSLIGVHTNKNEDNDVKKFTDWFMGISSGKLKVTWEGTGQNKKYSVNGVSVRVRFDTAKQGDEVKPYDLFAKLSGYIVPVAESLKRDDINGNPAQKLTFKTLKGITDPSQKLHAFDNPVDDTTGSFRKRLETTLATTFTAAKSNRHVLTAKEIYETMTF